MSPTIIDDTVKNILTSRVYDVAVISPLEKARKLSQELGCNVYLKREDLQPVHSFKVRGAYNKIVQLSEADKTKGVIAASAGNHAQGVALAAKKLGLSSLIIMPLTTPAIKVEAVKSYGAEVELFGDSYSDAAEYCKKRVEETGRTYIHPFDDPLVIAGQGTIGREIIDQLPFATHVFVPVGGGGLIAGIASYIKTLRPDIKVISVEPEDSDAMKASITKRERITLPSVGIFADGVAVKQVGVNTYATALDKVDDFITVTTDQICAAIKRIFEDTRSIVEPAGALGVAGIASYDLPSDAYAVAICSGANMAFESLQQIAERTLLGSGREAMFEVAIPEVPGALLKFCQTVISKHNITEFSYRLNNRDHAHILVGVSVSGAKDKKKFMDKMCEHEYDFTDMSEDDITKSHVRHMIGGPSKNIKSELIYEITFPERPGALGEFLQAIGGKWNVSLFHYRSTASDYGSVLVAFECSQSEKQDLDKALRSSSLNCKNIDNVPSVEIFLGAESLT